MAAKSPMFFRNTVERTTFSSPLPAAFSIPDKFFITRSVCAATSPLTTCCVAGSIATWPETNMNPFALTACEYGPIACGPSFVEMACFIPPPECQWQIVNNWCSAEVSALNFLQPLHLVHARNLAHSVDDVLQVLQIGNIEHYVDIGSPVGGARRDLADVCVGFAHHRRRLFQQSRAVATY